MELFLIDATGPFFRSVRGKRINWSKIPFGVLAEADEGQWLAMGEDLRRFAGEVAAQGYNAVSLDDLAHLVPHPWHGDELNDRILRFRDRFAEYFRILAGGFGLRVYLTSDVLPVSAGVERASGGRRRDLDGYFQDLVFRGLDDFPEVEGLIFRVGESDGQDVEDPVRTRLHLRNAGEVNRLLRALLPGFGKRGRRLVLRTWTVGAHRIGDMLWNTATLRQALKGVDSPELVVSMKHGESDFFRHLPTNPAFFEGRHRKWIELQARREYEGAGEYPSFLGDECERLREELRGMEGMDGVSVWCQTGGWHRFRRRAYLEDDGSDVWIRLNTEAVLAVFRDGKDAAEAVRRVVGDAGCTAALGLLADADEVISRILYIGAFARGEWFFRRVRIPPLFHVYWDTLFINHAVRKLVRIFVRSPAEDLRAAEEAFARFPRMMDLARAAGLPVEDIEHMRDFFGLLVLARKYYLLPYDPVHAERILEAKKAYKGRWPKDLRSRYRIRVSFEPFPVGRRVMAVAARVLLRRRREYRFLDRLLVIPLSRTAYLAVRGRNARRMPKLLRKSAMGVEAVLK